MSVTSAGVGTGWNGNKDTLDIVVDAHLQLFTGLVQDNVKYPTNVLVQVGNIHLNCTIL